MRIEFTITPDDLAALQRHGTVADTRTNVARATFQRNRRRLLFSAIFSSILWAAAVLTQYGQILEVGGIVLLSVSSLFLLFWWMVVESFRQAGRSATHKRIHAMLKTPAAVYRCGPASMEILPTHLRMEHRQHDVDQRWAGIVAIDQTPDHVFFRRADGGNIIVPKRVFGMPDEAAEFVALAWRYQLEAIGPIVRAHFAAHEIRCKKCGYSLRGNTGIACPECGEAIDLAPICAAWSGGQAPPTWRSSPVS